MVNNKQEAINLVASTPDDTVWKMGELISSAMAKGKLFEKCATCDALGHCLYARDSMSEFAHESTKHAEMTAKMLEEYRYGKQ